MHVGHRYYSPSVGRFLQRDPIGIRGGPNVYEYVGSNPLGGVDPSGLFFWCPGTDWGAYGGGKGDEMYSFSCGVGWGLGIPMCGERPGYDDYIRPRLEPRRERTRRWWEKFKDWISPSPFRPGTYIGGACFVEGTIILGEDGDTRIEELVTGDIVLTHNESSREDSIGKITKIYSNYTNCLVHIELPRETISCTKEHPFWVVGRGWVKADDLKPGHELLDAEGLAVSIVSMRQENLSAPIRIYNITVDGEHTYFVGKSRILVHNKI